MAPRSFGNLQDYFEAGAVTADQQAAAPTCTRPCMAWTGDIDRAAVLIARSPLLLTRAAEACAWAREAQERAKDAVQNMMEIRLAWALVRQRRDDPSSPAQSPRRRAFSQSARMQAGTAP